MSKLTSLRRLSMGTGWNFDERLSTLLTAQLSRASRQRLPLPVEATFTTRSPAAAWRTRRARSDPGGRRGRPPPARARR
eukprot:5311058-Prymnesium_polylepis.1